MDARLKIKSLSDLNEMGDAVMTLIRADNEAYSVTVRESDLSFLEARIAAVKLKATEKKNDAKAQLA